MCSRLTGNEDLVIFENVRPNEGKYVQNIVKDLTAQSTAVILVSWKIRAVIQSGHGAPWGFREAAEQYQVPLVEIPTEQPVCFLPSYHHNQSLSQPPELGLFAEPVHPNTEGHWLLACLISSILHEAAMMEQADNDDHTAKARNITNGIFTDRLLTPLNDDHNDRNGTLGLVAILLLGVTAAVLTHTYDCPPRSTVWHRPAFVGILVLSVVRFWIVRPPSIQVESGKNDTKAVQLEHNNASAVTSPQCFDMSSPDSTKRPVVVRSKGFDLHQIESSQIKRWWQAERPGDSITFRLPPSTEIAAFVYQRMDSMGMADVMIDGNQTGHVVDEWFKGFDWLPPERGFTSIVTLGENLPYTEHEVTFVVRNQTNSPDGSHSFQIGSLSCF